MIHTIKYGVILAIGIFLKEINLYKPKLNH